MFHVRSATRTMVLMRASLRLWVKMRSGRDLYLLPTSSKTAFTSEPTNGRKPSWKCLSAPAPPGEPEPGKALGSALSFRGPERPAAHEHNPVERTVGDIVPPNGGWCRRSRFRYRRSANRGTESASLRARLHPSLQLNHALAKTFFTDRSAVRLGPVARPSREPLCGSILREFACP